MNLIDLALKKGLIESADCHGAAVLTNMVQEKGTAIRLAAALAFSAPRRGSVFSNLVEDFASLVEVEGEEIPLNWARFIEDIIESKLVQRSDSAERRPLVLDENRLYLHRLWHYEHRLAQDILRLASQGGRTLPLMALEPFVDVLFPGSVGVASPQKAAALHFISAPFTVLTGGPGTGKTWTLRNALTLEFIRRWQEGASLPPVAVLAAPTGKAAGRMKDSIANGLSAHLSALTPLMPAEIVSQLETWLLELPTLTIHRLLGFRWDKPTRFRHDRDRPLNVDMLLIDEASMIDLALMSKLFAAVPNGTHLALVGDPNQLASVEAGTVLADICAQSHATQSAVKNHIVALVESRRFQKDKGIGLFSLNCLGGPAAHQRAIASLRDKAVLETNWIQEADFQPSAKVKGLIAKGLKPFFSALSTVDPKGPSSEALSVLFDQMGQFQILCAQRQGPYGVYELNLLAENALKASFPHIEPGKEYAGLRILIVRNDPSTGLYNGDMGLLLPTADGLRAFFPNLSRSFSVSRLPPWESATAMTIHKSQGSEFAHVLMVLPPKPSPIVSRELIYTGATRAKEKLTVIASERALAAGLENAISRHSGLSDKLLG